ncbi:MAG: asparagine--tRNA ligase [bacterium JZ-2024 1]
MTRLRILDLPGYAGKEVTLNGWLYNRRASGGILFLILRDGTGIVQCVAERATIPESDFQALATLDLESALSVSGIVRKEPRAPGSVEIAVSSAVIVSRSPKDYPIQKKEHSTGFLMDNRHFWIRTPRQTAILRVRHAVERAIMDHLDEAGYFRVDCPILTPAACEGTTTLFELDYFDQKAYLSQSGQLYNEATVAALGKVYCFGPTFRAEKSKTRRHLTEFWMVEPEIAFVDFETLLSEIESFVVGIVQRTLARARDDLVFLGRDLTKLERVQAPLPRITYTDAINLLQKKSFEVQWGDDFGGDEETAISEEFDRPVMITGYPAQIKAFYMKPDPNDPRITQSVDVIAPEGYGEIVGGSQRNDDYNSLLARIQRDGLPENTLQWYLDLRKYGSVPHGGWGLGLERTVAWVAGIEHIRETIAFPRTIYRIYP